MHVSFAWISCYILYDCRAEKSRYAAKKRRDQELEEMERLAQLLPFPEDVLTRLDKGTILKLAICYLQMKQFTKEGQYPAFTYIPYISLCSLLTNILYIYLT